MTVHLTDEQFEKWRVDQFRANAPEIMNVEETAVYIGIHPDTVRSKAAEGVIPCKKLGTRMLFSRESLRAWVSRPER